MHCILYVEAKENIFKRFELGIEIILAIKPYDHPKSAGCRLLL